MSNKKKINIYKSIIGLLLGGTILTTPIMASGCDKKDNAESTIECENKQYALISFGDSVQVIEYKKSFIYGNNGRVKITTYDDKEFTTSLSNIYFFDETSEEQVAIVNKILKDNKEETFPYKYIKK